jgi:hypothetical protein
MRLQIFSDLHADVAQPRLITVGPKVDAIIVAGDVCEGAENGFARVRHVVPMQVPIIMVMGNHEYYRRHLASELASARPAAPLYGVHLLENDVVVLSGVRFIGCSPTAILRETYFGEQECLTVFTSCGVGRPAYFRPSLKKRAHWSMESVSAADLATLSHLPDFTGLSLWRLIKAEDRIQGMGVRLMNINGLLNMVGWARSLDGHLIPHGDIPADFGADDRPLMIMVEQNAIRNVRHKVDVHLDTHAVRTPEGVWINATKEGTSIFKEDESEPVFVVHEEPQPSRWPRAVYETPRRNWWIELERLEGQSADQAFERYKMLKTWLVRMVPVLEKEFPALPEGTVVWHARFDGQVAERKVKSEKDFLTYPEALASLTVKRRNTQWPALQVTADSTFEDALFHPENIAERALVEKSVCGFAELAGKQLAPAALETLVQKIVPNTAARQSHAFPARRFRDFVQEATWQRPVLIDVDDIALLKLGLGWRARNRKDGGDILGKDACTAYLNTLVRILEDELCAELRSFDRRGVIDFALKNHESAIKDRDNWRRTAAAVLALHDDQEASLETIAEHDSELNAVFQSSRLLVEFAICECPVTGGRKPGRLDMSQLMTKVLQVSSLGGWSDAIRWDAMEPRLRITPLGDIHANMSFREEILAPYVRVGSDLTIKDSVESYAQNLKDAEVVVDVPGKMPDDFRAAFEEQLGASVDVIRGAVDFIEDAGINRREAIFRIKRSELIDEISKARTFSAQEVSSFLDKLTFQSRPEWRTVPDGCEERDRFPWRFRRRLSMLRLPLLQLEDGDDPELLVTPGILRDAISYMTRNYHRGDFPLRQLPDNEKMGWNVAR